MIPGFSFCGYPIASDCNADLFPGQPAFWKPCGELATPGHAYCARHATSPDPHSIGKRLTPEEIVDRAEAKREHEELRHAFVYWIAFAVMFAAAAMWQPVHGWLHTHLQFIAGILLGTVLELGMWIFVEWSHNRKRVAKKHSRPFCEARNDSFVCNRSFGHDGVHMHLHESGGRAGWSR